ncbi:MAG TPA: hypothetical protein VNO22_15950 [Planctomycetota bacterium]|nr:hypothetical protein [Planctomycetota bacterium]
MKGVLLVGLLALGILAAAFLRRPPGSPAQAVGAPQRPGAPVPADPLEDPPTLRCMTYDDWCALAALVPDPGTPAYPLEHPPPSWTAAMRSCWERLTSREAFAKILAVCRRFRDSDLLSFLTALSGELGIVIRGEPGVAGGRVQFRIGSRMGFEPGDRLLERMLADNGLSFRLEPDGALSVGPKGKREDPELQRARKIRDRLEELEEVGRRLREGWSGSDPAVPVELELSSRRLVFPADPRNLFEAVVQLRRMLQASGSKLYVEIDEFRLKEQGLTWDAPLKGALSAREGTLEDYVSWLATAAGVSWAVDGDRRIVFGPASWTEALRNQRGRTRASYVGRLAALDGNVPEERPWTVSELAEQLAARLGFEVVPSRNAWASGARSGGRTYRERLDALAVDGVRWALWNHRIYLLK